MSLPKAISFIRQHGNAVEQARLDHLLTAKKPSPEIVTAGLPSAQQHGRWPSDDGLHQDVHTTLESLHALK